MKILQGNISHEKEQPYSSFIDLVLQAVGIVISK